jgi:hypothetical protein
MRQFKLHSTVNARSAFHFRIVCDNGFTRPGDDDASEVPQAFCNQEAVRMTHAHSGAHRNDGSLSTSRSPLFPKELETRKKGAGRSLASRIPAARAHIMTASAVSPH